MAGLHVVDGKLSEYYNHFDEYEFSTCEATDTRLMGVVALRVVWIGKNNPHDKFYQVMHLDFSEYGVDDYFEFECIRGEEDYRIKREEMLFRWNSFLRVMGGKVVTIPCSVMLALIDSAIPLAADGRRREYDNEENAEFRRTTLIRWNLMKTSLENRGITGEGISSNKVIQDMSPNQLATCETINYFVMRLIDQDYVAAAFLSKLSCEELQELPTRQLGIQTLVRNNIKPCKDDRESYSCKMTTLAESGYYYISYKITLNGDYRLKNAKVVSIDVGSINKLSEYESAIQLQTTEYVTVFDCRDRILSGFDGNKFEFLVDVNPEQVENGWLYTSYNRDNSHVNSANYWLNDDVYGYAILTIDGEFVLMSNKLGNINYMDQAVITSLYSPFMELEGRYQIDTPVFHTLCHTHGVMFRQLIDYPDAF